jgi:MoxR-like ATPase
MPRDISKLPVLAAEFNAFIHQYDGMLVGRDQELTLIKLALLTREHVLLFGPPGTSKTLLCDLIYAGITDCETFAVEASKFMTEEAFFGMYNPKVMRESGEMVHNIEGMLPEANYARFGEMLDANEATLRALLGILNERRLVRGKQRINVPLHTAYCDTNVDPGQFLRRYPNGEAVLDRIMFMRKLEYLSDPKDVAEMVSRYQAGKLSRPDTTISHNTIVELSSYIVNPPGLITDQKVVMFYAEVVEEYRKRRREMSDEDKANFILPEISDRRLSKASMMVEASAVLNGRVEAIVTDVSLAGIVLCTSEAERKLWDEIVTAKLKEYDTLHGVAVNEAQLQQLKTIGEQLIRDVEKQSDTTIAADTLKVLWQQYLAMKPTDEVVGKHEELKKEFASVRSTLQGRINQQVGLENIG